MIQYIQINPNTGRVEDVLGSDGVLPIDGRWGAYRIAKEAETHQWKLRLVKPQLGGR